MTWEANSGPARRPHLFPTLSLSVAGDMRALSQAGCLLPRRVEAAAVFSPEAGQGTWATSLNFTTLGH